jgi:hypothetical protein
MGFSKSTEKSKSLILSLSFMTLSFQFGRYLLGVVPLPRRKVPQGRDHGHLRDAVDEQHSKGRSEAHLPIGRTSLHRARKPVMGRWITVCGISANAR